MDLLQATKLGRFRIWEPSWRYNGSLTDVGKKLAMLICLCGRRFLMNLMKIESEYTGI